MFRLLMSYRFNFDSLGIVVQMLEMIRIVRIYKMSSCFFELGYSVISSSRFVSFFVSFRQFRQASTYKEN